MEKASLNCHIFEGNKNLILRTIKSSIKWNSIFNFACLLLLADSWGFEKIIELIKNRTKVCKNASIMNPWAPLKSKLVEFHVTLRWYDYFGFQISLFVFHQNGNEINTFQLFCHIHLWHLKKKWRSLWSRLLRRQRSSPWLLCSLRAPWGPPPVDTRQRRWSQSWRCN